MNSFPILGIPRSAGEEALLNYQLTDAEKRLFEEIDRELSKLPEDSEIAELHEAAAVVGARHGLTAEQSVAFFTRTTFSTFEQ